MLFGSVPENNKPSKGHVYWFNYLVLETVIRKAGLHLEALRTNTFFPFSKFWPRAGNTFTNLLALSFVAKLRK